VTLNEKLKELEAETADQVAALQEYNNLGASVLAADLEENVTGLIATLRLAVEQRNDWAERYWNERMRPELTERTLSEDDAALLRKLEGEK
jgi:hypothetical protein